VALVFFRVLQGIGGGMIMPLAQLIMAQVAGPQRMGRVMAVVSMPAMLAPIFGPVIGGLILQNLHWSWIFFVNAPIGALAIYLGWRMLPDTDSGEAGPIDRLGLALLPASAALTIFGISKLGSGAAFGSTEVLVPLVVGVGLGLAFCWHALRIPRPLLDVRLYRNKVFAGASLTTFGLGAALFGAMILIPLYYQKVRGLSVIDTGLLNGPQGIGALVMMPIAGRLTERYGGGRIAIFGVSLLALSTIPLAFIGAHTSYVVISAVLFVRGISIGMGFMPAMTAAFAAMKPEQLSDATPQINVVMRLGSAVGVAILAVVLQRGSVGVHTTTQLADAFAHTYWWAFGIALLSLVPCLMLLRAERPSETEAVAKDQETESLLRHESAMEAGI
jgi:EmrB/QacA subfamily drug resistance transporter